MSPFATPVSDQQSASSHFSNAEILLWQGKFRRSFAALVGFVALSLKWTGLINSQSILVPIIGLQASLGIATVAVVTYLGFITAIGSRIAKTGRASRAMLYA